MRVLRLVLAAALCVTTCVAATRLQRSTDRPYDVEVVPHAKFLRWVSLGHPTLAANIYWLKTIQYIGDLKANIRGWDRLFPLVDLVTDLDPGHGYAYQVAGVMLGSVGHVDESNDILEKGMGNVPDRYILPFLRAFNAFYYEGDFVLAGKYVEIAASKPKAPAHLRDTAVAFYVKGREADAAISFLEKLRAEAQDPETAQALETQLKQAYLEKDAQLLDQAVERYTAVYGVPPFTLGMLVTAGFVKSIPEDPFGGEYVIGDDGRVHSSVNPFRYKRPEEMERRREPGVTPETGYPGAQVR